MKKLILGMASIFLLALSANAQEEPPMPQATRSGVNRAPKVRTPKNPSPTRSVSINGGGSVSSPSPVATSVGVSTPSPISTEGMGSVSVNTSRSASRTSTWNNQQEQQNEGPMKSKTFSKSYTIDKNDKITLSNVYGSIIIKIWDKNEIKVDADIKAYSNTEEETQKLLDDVSITTSKTGDGVIYKTTIGERNGNWGSHTKNGKTIWRREVKVYYTVYMPKSNPLNVSQDYGSLTIDDYNGPTSLKVQYGNIIGGDLNNANNYISAAYSKITFKDINQVRIKQEYGSGLNLGAVGTLDLDVQYAPVTIVAIKNSGNIKAEYGGGITISSANNITLNSHYIHNKIDNLTGNISAKLEYGGLTVGNVGSNVKTFTVNSEYAAINLAFGGNYSANFTVNTDFAPFRYGTNITAKKLGEEKGYSSSKSYSGQIGKGGTANVNVKADYGSVTFK